MEWSTCKTMILHIARRLSRPVANVKSSSYCCYQVPCSYLCCCMCIEYNKLSYRFDYGTKVYVISDSISNWFFTFMRCLRCYLMNGMWIAYVINTFPFDSLVVILLDHESYVPSAQQYLRFSVSFSLHSFIQLFFFSLSKLIPIDKIDPSTKRPKIKWN